MVDLRENENKTLISLKKLGGKATLEQIIKETRLPDAAVMRATMTLQGKMMIKTVENHRSIVSLTEEGKTYGDSMLPERRMIIALEGLGGEAPLAEIITNANLGGKIVPIALGWVRRKNWASFNEKMKSLRLVGKAQTGDDEKLLNQLAEKGKITFDQLDPALQEAVRTLHSRKLVQTAEKVERTMELTDAGARALKRPTPSHRAEVTQVSPELLISGKWRRTSLRPYDIEAAVASTWPGKKHPYLQFLDEVKQKLVALGFREMWGTAVETSFFNFDALYMPQDHPAREIFGIYLVNKPKRGDIKASKKVLYDVKSTHESGWKTGSTGWRYQYSLDEARRLILRGHGTCLSARTLLSKDLEIPGKYFSIARCYRPEVLDKTHLTEFNQVEGIIIDEKLSLRNLLGVLQQFALQIAGADEVRFKPDYFPFTEPSVELSAYKKDFGWIEFGGSGIFRPEVTLPLGIKVPVLAWGLGVDRLFMMRAGVTDIRQIFSLDLDWIRRKAVM